MNLTITGGVTTIGVNSAGLLVQSIGGGGGAASLIGYNSVQATLGGSNGSQGNGGTITLTNTGLVSTSGATADGVVLQSIGGGGGAIFTGLNSSQVSVATNSANSGNGGDINYTQNGNVVASGSNAIGVLAQSIGGGGGVVDNVFMGSAGGSGTSGNVNLTLNGSVTASGANGIGVLAQSSAAAGEGTISVGLAAGQSIYAGTSGIG